MVQAAMSNRSFRGSLEALLSKKLLAENGFDPELTQKENLSLFRIPVSPGKLGTLTDFMDRRLASHLRILRTPISKDIIRNLKKNYSEELAENHANSHRETSTRNPARPNASPPRWD